MYESLELIGEAVMFRKDVPDWEELFKEGLVSDIRSAGFRLTAITEEGIKKLKEIS